jgi:chemotaxis protein MotA
MSNLQDNFFAALTSTFWGLIFAIGFKLCDAFLSSRIEDNDKNVNLLLSRAQAGIVPADNAGENLQ